MTRTPLEPTSPSTPRGRPGPAPADGSAAGPALGVAVLVGLLWGAATSGLQTVLPWPFAGLANAVAPWVAPAFLAGARARRPGTAVLAGVLVCVAEVGGYYAVSALRGFGVNPATVAVWVVSGVLGGPVFGFAGWCWRRARTLRVAALGAALLGGVFLAEGTVTYGLYLGYAGDAVVFCVLGVVLLLALGAGASARRTGARGNGVRTTALWSLPVLLLGAAGEVLLHRVLT